MRTGFKKWCFTIILNASSAISRKAHKQCYWRFRQGFAVLLTLFDLKWHGVSWSFGKFCQEYIYVAKFYAFLKHAQLLTSRFSSVFCTLYKGQLGFG